MKRLGDWTDLSEMKPGHQYYAQISNALSSANFDYLEGRALEVRKKRNGALSPKIACKIASRRLRFAYGSRNIVFLVKFSDGLHWIARFDCSGEYCDELQQCVFESEVKTMQELRQKTTIPVPEIFDSDWSSKSPFGFPYMLIELMPGRSLGGSLAKTVPQEYYPKVASQLADIFLQLQKITGGCIGCFTDDPDSEEGRNIYRSIYPRCSYTLGSSFEYYSMSLNRHIAEVIYNYPNDPDWTTACWMLKLAVTHFLITNRVDGLFPLGHPDLHPGNLLFDGEYNITGVIDWTHAQTVPLERLLSNLDLCIAPRAPVGHNHKVKAFRRLVAEALESKERSAYISKARGNGKQGCGNKAADDPMETDNELATLMEKGPIGETWFSESAQFLVSEHYDIACWCATVDARKMNAMGKVIAKYMFNDTISWEKLVQIYGNKDVDF